MFNVYKNQQSRQTGSRNLTGPKTLPTIWYTYMKLVTKNFCHQQLLRKMRQKISWTDGRTDRGKTVYPPPPSGSGGIIKWYLSLLLFLTIKQVLKPMVFSHPVQYLGLFSLCQDRQPLTSQCPEWTCTCINCLCYTSTY